MLVAVVYAATRLLIWLIILVVLLAVASINVIALATLVIVFSKSVNPASNVVNLDEIVPVLFDIKVTSSV